MGQLVNNILETDHLVIGSGIAGMTLALKLAKSGRVTLVSKDSLHESNSWYAQGGIASVLSAEDSFAEHIRDTLAAGAGLCRENIVRMVVESGPQAIQELIDLGVDFTQERNADGTTRFHLTREGGHSQRRVIHANDLTGREVLRALIAAVQSSKTITVFEDQLAVDLITTDKFAPTFGQNECLGAYVLDRSTGGIYAVRSGNTYLCTGGHGKVYLYTSNPDGATGDGLAMGWRAGCKVANLEFMQFHPTCLFNPEAKTFLISEAVRGEGGILKTIDGKPFMETYHPLGSLAPRDIVARAIDAELKRTGASHVYLDARAIGAERIHHHFPNIYETCLKYGIDMTKDMIPVVPAAHYSCGGVVVDDWGRTNVANLYAIGEVACTGLHGANRLASNSLLEALVFANRVAHWVSDNPPKKISDVDIPAWDYGDSVTPDELVVLSHTWDEIRRMMWHYVGIVRTTKRLERAFEKISAVRNELNKYYWNYQLTGSFLEVRNLADIAYLTVRCAMMRKESRGIHYMADFPETKPKARDTVVW